MKYLLAIYYKEKFFRILKYSLKFGSRPKTFLFDQKQFLVDQKSGAIDFQLLITTPYLFFLSTSGF
jgi:hypothetical protein